MMYRVQSECPPLFCAETMYWVSAWAWVGAPVMAPVLLLICNPAGNAGCTVYDVGAPPPFSVGVTGSVSGVLIVYVMELMLYVKPVGGCSNTLTSSLVVM